MQRLANTPPKLIVMDEFWSFFEPREAVRELLRTIPAVPQYTYLAKGDKVFVFEVLVTKALQIALSERTPQNIVALLPSAWVTSEDAVRDHNVVPYPYQPQPASDGRVDLVHRALNAKIPGGFDTMAAAQDALIRLLTGNTVSVAAIGPHCFELKGQVLEPLNEFGRHALPAVTRLWVARETTLDNAPLRAHSPAYRAGLPHLSEQAYYELLEDYRTWQVYSSAVSAQVRAAGEAVHAWPLWADLAPRTKDSDVIPDYGVSDLQELRREYPELASWSDGALYHTYDAYAEECCHLRGWTAYREVRFLQYVLGAHAVPGDSNGDHKEFAGRFAMAALLTDLPLSEALAIGRQSSAYADALSLMEYRAGTAVAYLTKLDSDVPGQGPEARTFTDMLRSFRKVFPVPPSPLVSPVQP